MKSNAKIQCKPLVREATPEIPNVNFWTMRIEPGGPTVIGENISPGIMVFKNHGPGSIVVDTGHNYDNVKLLPGRVKVIATYKKVEAKTIDKTPALLEFEYMPKFWLK
jgi:hypothetical protein